MAQVQPPESVPKLFQPVRVGEIELAHHVVFAPCTRLRATKDNVHTSLGVTYYEQRASVPGTLLISEAALMEPQLPHAPGIFTEEQIAGWEKIVDAVHAKGSYIYVQLWDGGRAIPRAKEAGLTLYSASPIPVKGQEDAPVHEMTIDDIKRCIALFTKSASDAVERAGFDGVELHGANGYLIDQFIQDLSNHRTDEYGGSIENRARFPLELVKSVSKAIGIKKTALRLSPWATGNDMGMEDPRPTFSYLVKRLAEDFPELAYLHVIEPGVSNYWNIPIGPGNSNDFIRDIWLPRTLISAGRYYRKEALERAEQTGELIAFGRLFISNPDLPLRLRKNLHLEKWDHDTYYTPEDPHGFIDYPFADDNTPLADEE
ncbi:NADH:flavin oxidoreductase/NADH oxidase [Lentinus tigrinus ALCF2SS1-7]|uniref:NADH:flavin oxidoreductase/NADH oxidase n=1 Tax=Lentinus tigrinus ALCF2SS1-6 TaxID=1328759 RepID=A0A5C2T1S2_9APHY|nr:NADH:flavin oxidoreductase/NADH oxidase [Lentinus tigrinus ALCF2SS1-6]RPD80410.1 NADH:flavin oxidoreductase/NADH oxidase [Lentinus tigrinus ALCF2SS1-7]